VDEDADISNEHRPRLDVPGSRRVRWQTILAAGLSAIVLAGLAAPRADALPDNRVDELVTTSGDIGEPYSPPSSLEQFGPFGTDLTPGEHPFQSSENGDAVTYVGEPPLTGGTGEIGPGLGDQWLARRTALGWQSEAITPPAPVSLALPREAYQAFTSDLSTAFFIGGDQSRSGEVPQGCRSLYARAAASGAYRAVFTPHEAPAATSECGRPLFAGASEHEAHIIFQSEAALTANAQSATEIPPTRSGHSEAGGQYGEACMFGCNLYDATGGHLHLVNVLPSGEAVDNATFGGASAKTEFFRDGSGETFADFSNAISADGSKVFWTDTQPGPDFEHVFVRKDGTTTVPVSGAGAAEYWTATPDGRYAYYTEAGELWQFDTLTNTPTRLTAPEAGVQGVIGTNQTGEDGSYIYFVAEGALAPGATSQVCRLQTVQNLQAIAEEKEGLITSEQLQAIQLRLKAEEEEELNGATPQHTGCNLYLRHEGRTIFIASLAPTDNKFEAGGSGRYSGDWKANLGERAAEVTPDGHHAVFQSFRSLTGYDNNLKLEPLSPGHPIAEAFVYSADEGRLSCASCNPAGAPPVTAEHGAANNRSHSHSSRLPVSLQDNTYTHRWISNDGNRVFFDSEQPLSPADENARQDVYEWEREGTPGCPVATSKYGGCVYLLSGANTQGYSFLVDADATGNNVFFEHQGPLGSADVPPDRNQLYDARVDGGFPNPQICTGCESTPPSAAQSFANPATTAFSGAGNYPPPPANPPVKRLTNAQKLANAVKACRKKHDRHKRIACERSARRRYGPAHRATKGANTTFGRKSRP
jgi:hypothetical protein